MSNAVNWGHWVVGAFFAAWGLDSLWSTIVRFPSMLREHPGDITYVVVSDAFLWVAALMCAWGIFKWRSWARKLGIVLSALWAVAFGVMFSIRLQTGIKPNLSWLLFLLTGCIALIWLFLPAVRAEYSRRNQIA